MVKDVYEITTEYLANKSPHILGKIFGRGGDDFVIEGHDLRILKRGAISSMTSVTLDYRDRKNNEGVNHQPLFIKVFESPKDRKGRVKTYKDFGASTEDTCNLLSEVTNFPHCYFSERDGNTVFLIMQRIGDQTLHDVRQGLGPVETRNVVQSVFPYLSRFQIRATENLERRIREGKMTKKEFYSLFGKRSSAERIIDYLRSALGKDSVGEVDKNLVERVLRLSVPIQRIYEIRRDSFRVTHGDPIFKNIIKTEGGENSYEGFGFIDAELAVGESLRDWGALLATPNLNLKPSDWYFLNEVFNLSDGRELEESGVNLHQVRGELVKTLGDLGVEFSDEEPPGNSYFYGFGALFFRSGRIMAKVNDLERYDPEQYNTMAEEDPGLKSTSEDAKRTMSLSLDEMVSDPGRFELSRQEYIDNLGELKDTLIKEGIINKSSKYSKPADKNN